MPIPARSPATLGQLPKEWNGVMVRDALNSIVQSVPPYTVRSVVAATTIDVNDDLIVCDTTAGAFAVTLLPADQVQFLKVTIANIGANTLTITGTVSGAVNPTLAQWKVSQIQSDGVRWVRIGGVV